MFEDCLVCSDGILRFEYDCRMFGELHCCFGVDKRVFF